MVMSVTPIRCVTTAFWLCSGNVRLVDCPPFWNWASVGDVASLPLLVAVFLVFMFLATPITNTLIRTQEIEADRFGLNLAREPRGQAEVDLKLTEYRKPDPGPIEEFIFFDHPSTRFRIHDAMRWREAMGTP